MLAAGTVRSRARAGLQDAMRGWSCEMGLWPGAGRLPSECGVAGYPVFWMGVQSKDEAGALGVSTVPDLGGGRPGRRRRCSGGQ